LNYVPKRSSRCIIPRGTNLSDRMNQSRRKFLKFSALSALFLSGLRKAPDVTSICSTLFDDDDEQICKKKFDVFINANIQNLTIGQVIVEVGRSFQGAAYIGGTLDVNPQSEQLIVRLTGFDCVTFVENGLAFARCLKKGKTTFEDYKSELLKIRYRDGVIDGYASRLHYFTDWIYDNEVKGIVWDITQQIGGIEYVKEVNFMSKHPGSYKQLSDKQNLDNIRITEEAINSRPRYYIPLKSISRIYDSLQDGDIIATTTNIAGLDVTHTGYVYKGEDGGTYFLHASSKGREVIISPNQLQDYVEEDSKKTGIIVARPLEPL
jgi:hypothetical protein